MKKEMVIPIVVAVAVIIVVIFLAFGAMKIQNQTVTPPPATPVPTETATPVVTQPVPTAVTPAPTPEIDFVGYIQRGTAKVELAKIAVQSGRLKMDDVMQVRGQYPDVITTLYNTKTNFTNARKYYIAAQADYNNATATAPRSVKEQLDTLTSILNADVRNVDRYVQSTDLSLANDWYNANDVYNRANVLYQSNLQSTNSMLYSMNLL
jgi:hypothetical protein